MVAEARREPTPGLKLRRLGLLLRIFRQSPRRAIGTYHRGLFQFSLERLNVLSRLQCERKNNFASVVILKMKNSRVGFTTHFAARGHLPPDVASPPSVPALSFMHLSDLMVITSIYFKAFFEIAIHGLSLIGEVPPLV